MDEVAPAERRPSWKLRLRRLVLVAALAGFDLWSKTRAFEYLTQNRFTLDIDVHHHSRHLLFGEWFAFMASTNKGAIGGVLESVPHLLVGGRLVAVASLIYLVVRATRGRRQFTAGLMLILAGATGNVCDNLFQPAPTGRPFGEVRDFIDVYFAGIGESGYHFPTFNVADVCIFLGACLLLLSGFGNKPASPSSETA